MYAVTIFSFTIPISKELLIKKAADEDSYLGWDWSKI